MKTEKAEQISKNNNFKERRKVVKALGVSMKSKIDLSWGIVVKVVGQKKKIHTRFLKILEK